MYQESDVDTTPITIKEYFPRCKHIIEHKEIMESIQGGEYTRNPDGTYTSIHSHSHNDLCGKCFETAS